MKHYDVMVIGGGPAGLSAAIYAARSGVSVAVAEELVAGGVMAATPVIENYPGYKSIFGYELAQKMEEQAVSSGACIIYSRALKITDGEIKKVTLSDGSTYDCFAVVIAAGNSPRKLGVKGENELLGAGLSYCATCDGNFFRGKTVIVAGAGKHALSACEYLQDIVKEVITVNPYKTPITALIGNPLDSVEIDEGGVKRVIKCDGLFVELGYEPSSILTKDFVKTDGAGYVVCDERMQTDRNGIFAAGDIVSKPLRQIATAVSDGAIAGQFAAVYAKKRANR